MVNNLVSRNEKVMERGIPMYCRVCWSAICEVAELVVNLLLSIVQDKPLSRPRVSVNCHFARTENVTGR